MDAARPALIQTYGSRNEKPRRSASSENSGVEGSTSFMRRLENPQGSITGTDDSLVNDAKKCIGRFFYENGLDVNAVRSPSFQSMISLCSGQMKYMIPTSEELKGWIFKDAVKEMRESVKEIRNSWADTGCSVLLDGWMDAKGRHLINILVDSPRGTVYLCSFDISDCIGNMDAMQSFMDKVLMEVGIDNIVQIMTYSTSAFMKEVGKQLMEKYRPIFWTVSASCCIELMLEKMTGINLIRYTLGKAKTITRFVHSNPDVLKHIQDQSDGNGLVVSSKTRFTQPFLTLENIVLGKETLKTLFLSSDPRSSALTSTAEGKKVADILVDQCFWNKASVVLNAAIPLVRVIEWMNAGNKEQMGYVNETINQAKERIKDELKHKKYQYKPFWKAIDDVWKELLYSPLHSAGYFLNPNLFYSTDVYIDPEVVTGLFCCIVRSSEDLNVQDRITVQLEQYRIAKGAFGVGSQVDKRSNISPAIWWSRYGGQCPELQKLAIRILSQTCDGASKFQLKRGLAEQLLTRGRSQAEQKRAIDVVFLRYNMQLQNFTSGDTSYITPNEISPMDDWVRNDAPQNNDVTKMEVDGGDTTDRGVGNSHGASGAR
ncbi:hypothetical protein Salat_0849200 [Sesamum alatum]|uniref:DUF659 domain-containing protein n=1 Tax=Sesamum alatum TaxID=300844 RepID=A0AAE1YIH0_9LAMI|nr:hypothetical protein Salat_0849200 [Sesamum alatum]